MTWTAFNTPEELRYEIDSLIFRLTSKDPKAYKDIHIHFLPMSTFQEHAMQNGWTDEYMNLAARFDKLYEPLG